jgi:Metal binding domain of Ada
MDTPTDSTQPEGVAKPGGKLYTLLGGHRRPYLSAVPGQLGGHRKTKIYGRLDCRVALRAIDAGGYVRHRVFFADEHTAVQAGYRPCAICMPEAYQAWKLARGAKAYR